MGPNTGQRKDERRKNGELVCGMRSMGVLVPQAAAEGEKGRGKGRRSSDRDTDPTVESTGEAGRMALTETERHRSRSAGVLQQPMEVPLELPDFPQQLPPHRRGQRQQNLGELRQREQTKALLAINGDRIHGVVRAFPAPSRACGSTVPGGAGPGDPAAVCRPAR